MRALLSLCLLLTHPAFAQITTTQFCWPSCSRGVNVVLSGSANQLRCVELPSPFSITSAHNLTIGIVTGAGGAVCGLGLYDSGGTLIAGTNGACATSGVAFTANIGGGFSMTGGTSYRMCACSSSTSVDAWTIRDDASASQQLTDALNAGATTVGTAANSCTAGVLPGTTGSITPAVFSPLMVVIE